MLMKTTKRLLISNILAFAMIGFGAAAHANSVSFTTSGAFNGGGNSITFGAGGNTLQIVYTGMNTVNLNDTPFTFSSLGDFQTSITGTGATITSGSTFTLTIDQTQPSSGTGFLAATLTGTLQQNQSSGLVTFSTSSVTIGADTYALTNSPLPLVPPSTNNGITTVQARISGPGVPDGGATALLLGTALMALAGTSRIWRPALRS